jgi:hypothetical protein
MPLSSDFPHPDESGHDHLSDRSHTHYTLDLSSIFYPLSAIF